MALSEVRVPPFYRGNWQGDVIVMTLFKVWQPATACQARMASLLTVGNPSSSHVCLFAHKASCSRKNGVHTCRQCWKIRRIALDENCLRSLTVSQTLFHPCNPSCCIVLSWKRILAHLGWSVETMGPCSHAFRVRPTNQFTCQHTGVIILPTQTRHDFSGKSFKITIYLHCLIPPKWVI